MFLVWSLVRLCAEFCACIFTCAKIKLGTQWIPALPPQFGAHIQVCRAPVLTITLTIALSLEKQRTHPTVTIVSQMDFTLFVLLGADQKGLEWQEKWKRNKVRNVSLSESLGCVNERLNLQYLRSHHMYNFGEHTALWILIPFQNWFIKSPCASRIKKVTSQYTYQCEM